MADVLRLLGQFLALILISVVMTLGMAIIVAVHDILLAFLKGDIGGFFVVFISLALFISLLYAAFKWVQTRGFGMFAV